MLTATTVRPPKVIVLTGGGTAGHVCAHLALIRHLQDRGYSVIYIGSRGIERRLLADVQDVSFVEIKAGKLRRYLSLQNLWDLFRTGWGVVQSFIALQKNRPEMIISRGGYVSFPPTLAGWLLRIPVVLVEADVSLGLAARLALPFTSRVFCAFPETYIALPEHMPFECIPLPLRPEIYSGETLRGLEMCGWLGDSSFSPPSRPSDVSQSPSGLPLPVLLVMGGSSGSALIENLLAGCLGELLQRFYIIYLGGTSTGLSVTGSEKTSPLTAAHNTLKNTAPSAVTARLASLPYVFSSQMGDLYAITDMALSRGGANGLFELISLGIPSLIVPLERGSRGEQLENARALQKRSLIYCRREHELSSDESLLGALEELQDHYKELQEQLARFCDDFRGGAEKVMSVLWRVEE